jgi:hypothetical protein
MQLGIIGTLNATVFSLEKLSQSLKSAESITKYYEQGAKVIANWLQSIDSRRNTIDFSPSPQLVRRFLNQSIFIKIF